MKKFMMAAVALICMTMTSVLTACGDDNDSKGDKEIICEYGILTDIASFSFTGNAEEGNPWNKVVNDTNKKVKEILAKYSGSWSVKATTSNVQQVIATNDAEAKQKVEDMKKDLNKVFTDLESLQSTYPDEYIRCTISVVAMHDVSVSGILNERAFIEEEIYLSFGNLE